MSWIDKRLEERDELERRNRLIDNHAIKIYMAVWDEMMKVVQEALPKGFPLSPGGSLQERTVLLSPRSGSPRTLGFTMRDNRREIIASWDGAELQFSLDICDGGVVCIKHNNAQISEHEVARLIFDPFLFPELDHTVKKSAHSSSGFQSTRLI